MFKTRNRFSPTRRTIIGLLLWVLLMFLESGCGYYSFTGASIPSHLGDIAIPLAEDNTASPVTTLADDLTRLLVERFVGQTRLSLEPDEEDADVVLTTTIQRYSNDPAAVTADERAGANRVTLQVTVRYFDRVNNEEILQRSFSSFAEYDPVVTGLDGEVEAARVALNNIADDIFTAATSNW